MPPCIPAHRSRQEVPGRIRVVTWNVHEEFGHVLDMSAVLAKLAPDIVCLQEARRATFGEVLAGGAVAHTHEVTTITRGRILAQREIRLGPLPNFRWGLETDIELPQGRVKVFNVHFLTSFNAATLRRNRYRMTDAIERTELARERERDIVLEWLRETAGPRVVAGDFNTPPNSVLYRDVATAAVDAFGRWGLGWGWTYRRDYPMLRIDYVFCGEGVTPLRAFTMDGRVSDHRMVVADVALGDRYPDVDEKIKKGPVLRGLAPSVCHACLMHNVAATEASPGAAGRRRRSPARLGP